MIVATFHIRNARIRAFRIQGHAGYADSGADIVCSAVSVASHMTALGILETLGLDGRAEADAESGGMFFEAAEQSVEGAQAFLQTLRTELQTIQKQYPDCLTVQSIRDPS